MCPPTIHKRTSYNTRGGVHQLGGTPFRKNYTGVGHIYDPVRDAFYAPQPYDSWILNEDSCIWEAPTAKPDDGIPYVWNENTTSWDTTSPYPSWTWNPEANEGIGDWEAPISYPIDDSEYIWNEETLSWE